MSRVESDDFYKDLASFGQFEYFSDDRVFHSVPADWAIVIADIEDSTRAVQKGRYRDVNTLGAAAIAVVQAACPDEPIPFVFGGDGATFLVPPIAIEAVKEAMRGLRLYAKSQFKLRLRVGLIGVGEVQAAGQQVEVAKFELTSGKFCAFIRGGGLQWADESIKKNPKVHSISEADLSHSTAEFAGLSCRWQPLPSKNGIILTLMVQTRKLNSTFDFAELLAKLSAILGGDLDSANPVQLSSMQYKGLWRTLREEWRFTDRKLSKRFGARLFEIALCVWTYHWKLPSPFNAPDYLAQIPSHSDYRKYDDMLRLILDCTRPQADAIKALLQKRFESGEILFGTHESSHALMTCLVDNIRQGGHIHFIDGAGGGYTLAAKQMKNRAKSQGPHPSKSA